MGAKCSRTAYSKIHTDVPPVYSKHGEAEYEQLLELTELYHQQVLNCDRGHAVLLAEHMRPWLVFADECQRKHMTTSSAITYKLMCDVLRMRCLYNHVVIVEDGRLVVKPVHCGM